jgi:uncharacterized protein YndB with AHSA1/START domain
VRVESDRWFDFDVGRATLWAAIAAVDDYPRWWPWVRQLDAQGLIAGDVWRCTIQPPLPYRLVFEVRITDVDPERTVVAHLTGDLVGTARLDVEGDRTTSRARLASDLMPANGIVRGVAAVAPPLARYGHDWVLRTGARQFARRALAR